MQFNKSLTIKFPLTFDDFGKPATFETFSIKCAILSHLKQRQTDGGAQRHRFDLVIIMPSKAYEPYSEIFDNQAIVAELEGVRYNAALISKINDFSGKSKYYEITFTQDRGD